MPDRAAAPLSREMGAQEGQAAGHDERRADALDGARDDQLLDVGRQAAPGGSGGEDDGTDGEQPLAPEMIAEHAADENERGQEQRIGFDDPLQRRDIGVEAALDRRQRHIDRGGVDDGDARAAHRRRENASVGEAAMRRRARAGKRRSTRRPVARNHIGPLRNDGDALVADGGDGFGDGFGDARHRLDAGEG